MDASKRVARSAHPIIVTKLQPPIIGQKILRRERLERLFDQVFDYRITLVCAAAGYGKTTALAGLPARYHPVVWYSLSQSDAEPVAFLNYLSEGIASILSQTASSSIKGHLARACARQDLEACVAYLTNALSSLDKEVAIVLDDYQFVEHSKTGNLLLDLLVSHVPPKVHLVISSRSVVSIPSLPRLSASGEVLLVGQEELRFTRQEAAEMMERSNGLDLSLSLLDALIEKTEGWPIGLQLAGQMLRNRPSLDAAEFLSHFTASQRPLFDYLAQEVFSQQPPEVQEFLLQSSVLSSLDAPTCDAVLRRSDARQILDHLRQSNLLEGTPDFSEYRYHRLFRDFLLDRLSQDRKALTLVHEAAAHHYHRAGNEELAIHHFLMAGMHSSAASLISSVAEALLRESRFDTLLTWIGLLPSKVVEEFPEIIVRRAEIEEIRGHYDSSLRWYEWAAKLYRDRDDLLGLSRVLRSKGYILNWRIGETEDAGRLHNEALSLLSEEHKAERAAVLRDLARDRLSAGDTASSFSLYNQAIQIYEDLGDKEGQLSALISPGAWLYFDKGDFARGVALLHKAAALARELDCKHQLAEIYNVLATHLFLWGRVEEAGSYALQALELSQKLGCDLSEGFALMNLANVNYEANHDTLDQAVKRYDRALQIFKKVGNRRFTVATLNFMSMALRHKGDTANAIQLARRAVELAKTSTASWIIAWARLTLAAALLEENPREARLLLDEATHTFESYDAKFRLTFGFLCLAVLAKEAGEAEWQEYAGKCLKLSKDGGYDHVFRRESALAVPLLLDALEAGLEAEYVAELLSTLGPRSVDRLVLLLSHQDLAVRKQAVHVLGRLGGNRAWKALLKCASSPLEPLQKEANAALVHMVPPEQPLLEITCFGAFSVKRGQALIGEDDWKRKKVKSLLKYLVSRPGLAAAKDEIVDAIWPDLDPLAANNNFYRTLHHLRRVLDPPDCAPRSRSVLFDDGVLSIADDAIARIDIHDFRHYLAEAKSAEQSGDLDAARALWQAAAQLYQGDFLADDRYEDWLLPIREEFRELYVAALVKLGDYWAWREKWDVAADHLHRALVVDPTREELHLRLMSWLDRAGNRVEALLQYRRCEKILKAELDVEPAPETKAYYRRLLAGVTYSN